MLVTALKSCFSLFELSSEDDLSLFFLDTAHLVSKSVKAAAFFPQGLVGLELECILSDGYELNNKACD